MFRRWLFTGVLLALVCEMGAGQIARAQDGGEDTPAPLTLLSVDAAFPVLFQTLAPGETPDSARLTPLLALDAEQRTETPLIYVAVENTGWSRGAVGVLSDELDANADYVALEVRDLGMAGYIVREDGQALAFPLDYVPDLGPEGEPGFRFDIVVGEVRSLRIFRVVESDGLMLFAQQTALTDAGRAQERVTLMIDPQPVFGDLLLEIHIQALPGQLNTPAPEPEDNDAPAVDPLLDSDGDGVPDVDDLCPDAWGGLPNGCVQDWDAEAPAATAADNSGGGESAR